ncbi:hypothetical protein AB0M94_38910 [Streptomyces xanthochromogenes]|uniref:hypothetical protein n=1 Tax=Streptomyces xanthochromogenes TaxID=67384 RepID=UPI003423732D
MNTARSRCSAVTAYEELGPQGSTWTATLTRPDHTYTSTPHLTREAAVNDVFDQEAAWLWGTTPAS